MSRRDGGFSLLELMVAMTLLGLVGVMAADGLRFGRAAWERAESLGETTVETRAVQRYLARQIAASRPIRVRDGSRTPPVLFEGRAGSLAFAAPIRAHLAPRGDHLIGLSLEQGGLVLRWVRLGDRRPSLSAAGPGERLVEEVAGFGLRYYGPAADGGPAAWQRAWIGRETLPELVELAIAFEGGREPAPLVLRLEGGPAGSLVR
ncbi:MAG: prepilin-type N-terminal cleavage/methylation domain-containing protein [Pseudomonadota bacterium]